MSRYEVKWYIELCCELCHEPIHNHFDCPICETKRAGTSMYGDVVYYIDEPFSCEECGTTFRIVEYYGLSAVVEVVESCNSSVVKPS